MVVVKHDLHKYISCSGKKEIDKFVAKYRLQCYEQLFDLLGLDFSDEDNTQMGSDDDEEQMEYRKTNASEELDAPKMLGDLLESLVGAIFVDSQCSLDAVWRVLFRLIKPDMGKSIALQFDSLLTRPELMQIF